MPTSTELAASLAALQGPYEPKYDQLKQFLQLTRDARAPLPELVFKHGHDMLRRFSHRLTPDELWALRETVAVAAMQTGHVSTAQELVRLIGDQFPTSARSGRLQGMLLESAGDFDTAEQVYTTCLQSAPDNNGLLRRFAAAKAGRGDLIGAVESLQSYLNVHMTDWMAWEEAASLYLRLGALSQAIFCLEEVLLHQPGNVSVQLLLADTLYSAGGPANLRAARGYYSAAIEATEGSNVKALYGVCVCVAQLAGAGKRGASGSKATADADEEGEAVAEVAGEELLARHARLAPDKLSMVKGMLKAQRLLR